MALHAGVVRNFKMFLRVPSVFLRVSVVFFLESCTNHRGTEHTDVISEFTLTIGTPTLKQ